MLGRLKDQREKKTTKTAKGHSGCFQFTTQDMFTKF